MRRVVRGWSLAVAFGAPLAAQMLVVDRGFPTGAAPAGPRLGRTDAAGFIGDHFQIGNAGEVWVIDAIRMWAADARGASKATLFGGLETAAPAPGQPPQPECDCHNLMTIKTAALRPDAPVSGGVRQVDFQELHWSVPGGVPIQFGVMGSGGGVWLNQMTETGGVHELKAFDDKGKLEGPYTVDGAAVDARIGLNLQVWAHKSAPVAIRSAGATIEVVLRSDRSFDAAKADPSTLRFGPRNAAPVASRVETVENRQAVVARFRRVDTGIQGAVVSACLIGRQQDGVPFEGCDLVGAK